MHEVKDTFDGMRVGDLLGNLADAKPAPVEKNGLYSGYHGYHERGASRKLAKRRAANKRAARARAKNRGKR